MANKLSQERRDALFAAWCENQSVRYVARVCNTRPATIYKYRGIDKWDDRITELRQKAQKKTDDTLAARLAKRQNLLRAAFEVYTAALLGKIPAKCPDCQEQAVCPKCGKPVQMVIPKITPSFRDIEALVKTEATLFGQAGGLDVEPKRIRYPLVPKQEKENGE